MVILDSNCLFLYTQKFGIEGPLLIDFWVLTKSALLDIKVYVVAKILESLKEHWLFTPPKRFQTCITHTKILKTPIIIRDFRVLELLNKTSNETNTFSKTNLTAPTRLKGGRYSIYIHPLFWTAPTNLSFELASPGRSSGDIHGFLTSTYDNLLPDRGYRCRVHRSVSLKVYVLV